MHTSTLLLPEGVEILGKLSPEFTQILSPRALAFVAKLARKFEARRSELLAFRAGRQAEFDAGKLPDFLPESRLIREGDWKVSAVPAELRDRRVEITGPADRKMVINALNSRAYALLLIRTCHKRNTFAMGGMAARIPVKNDAAATRGAIDKVRADEIREATDGCDGTWVAHPDLVEVARTAFDEHMHTPNQIYRKREDGPHRGPGPARLQSGHIPFLQRGIVSNGHASLEHCQSAPKAMSPNRGHHCRLFLPNYLRDAQPEFHYK